MKSSTLLKEIQQLRQGWRNQNFNWVGDQRKRYDELMKQRRELVRQWYKEDRVWKGPSMVGKKKEEKENAENKG